MSSTIYTIGHSNIEPSEFIKRVKQFNIELLVDVRSKPYSRHVPHFNKEKIEYLCKSEGIKYSFLGNLLGGKPEDDSITVEREDINYDLLAEAKYFISGIDKLLELIGEYRVCLMCSEAQPNGCHRNLLISPALEERGIEVLHILPDGTAISSNQLKLKIRKGQLNLF